MRRIAAAVLGAFGRRSRVPGGTGGWYHFDQYLRGFHLAPLVAGQEVDAFERIKVLVRERQRWGKCVRRLTIVAVAGAFIAGTVVAWDVAGFGVGQRAASFEGVPLGMAVARIERDYGVVISMETGVCGDLPVTAELYGACSVEEVLSVVARAAGMSLSEKGTRGFLLTGPGCRP